MVTDAISGPDLHDAIAIKDGAYGVPWKQKIIDLSGLEMFTKDYAEYLTNTVLFTFSPLYYLFDKQRFFSKIDQFYNDRDAGKPITTGLWHIQLLAVFALGKSILAREPGPDGPVGAVYFARAVEAFPDGHRLGQDCETSVELLVLFALFAQAMDMRVAAHNYVSKFALLEYHYRSSDMVF
jgi:hypothetical protein